MTLSEMLVLLIMQQKWRNVILVDADPEVSGILLKSLSEEGVPVASVTFNMVDRYQWPEKVSLHPPFDGYIMIVDLSGTDEIFRELLCLLKKKFMFGPHQRWIIGINGFLNLEKAHDLFDEGDRVLIVSSNITKSMTRPMQLDQPELRLWSLHSLGNGSVTFNQKGLWVNDSVRLEDRLFDMPFTDFGGRVLRISSLGSPPIQEPPEPGDWKWSGYIFKIVNTLSDIYNFSYIVKEAENRLYGMLQDDGTWSGTMGELVNKSVDMGVGDLSWTLGRSIAADLTCPVFAEKVTFIYRAPGFYSRTWILFEDVDFRVWISLTSIMILGCTVYCLTLCISESCRNKAVKDHGGVFVQSAVRSTGAIYRSLLGQSIVNHPKAISCRTILGTWFMGTLILSALYGGSLTSTLSLHRSPRPADTLKELVKRYPNAFIAMRNNSQIHSFFRKSDLWRPIWIKNMQNNVIPGKFRIDDIMREVHRRRAEGAPIYVWVAERSMLVKQMHKYSDDRSVCDLYVAKEPIVNSDWVLALTRNSPFLQQFNEKITQLHRFGLLQKWQIDFWNSGRGQCRPNDGRNPTGRTAISIDDTQACFFILSMGWLSGFITLLVEKWIVHRKID